MASGAESEASSKAASPANARPKAARKIDVAALMGLCGLEEEEGEAKKARTLTDDILKLREEQIAVRNERKRIQKDLKNAQRRKRRLKEKARQLTDQDLLAVLLLRQKEKSDGESAAKEQKESAGSAEDAGRQEESRDSDK